jgi:phosphoglycolate phosphatase-like HAD superfamily hydrolase
MAMVGAADKHWDIDLVVFDKDGTLIDFHWLWGQRVRAATDAVTRSTDTPFALRTDIFAALGYDPTSSLTRADAPLAVAPMEKLSTLVAGVLYRNGIGWHEAEELVAQTFAPALGTTPDSDQIRAHGNLRALFTELKSAGIRIALLTTDNRAATEATLPILGVEALVDAVICGDDPVAAKPSPVPLLKLGRQFSVHPDRIMMVGDTVCDMMTGRNAEVGCCLAVRTGASEQEALAACAHAVVDSVHDIRV